MRMACRINDLQNIDYYPLCLIQISLPNLVFSKSLQSTSSSIASWEFLLCWYFIKIQWHRVYSMNLWTMAPEEKNKQISLHWRSLALQLQNLIPATFMVYFTINHFTSNMHWSKLACSWAFSMSVCLPISPSIHPSRMLKE